MKHFPLLLLILALVVATMTAIDIFDISADNHLPFPYEEVARFDQAGPAEPSGIVFHPQRKTLFVAGDQGQVSELQTDGTLVQHKKVRRGADFEGITCHPLTGQLYVAVEGEELILEVSPEFLEITREIPIDRSFEDQILLDPEGNGIEDITIVPAANGDTFYLANQGQNLDGPDPSIIFAVTLEDNQGRLTARINHYFTLGLTDLSGLYYDPARQHLLVISDSNDLLLEVSLAGRVLASYHLPGQHQEGITLDDAGFLYLAQDSKKRILKFGPILP